MVSKWTEKLDSEVFLDLTDDWECIMAAQIGRPPGFRGQKSLAVCFGFHSGERKT